MFEDKKTEYYGKVLVPFKKNSEGIAWGWAPFLCASIATTTVLSLGVLGLDLTARSAVEFTLKIASEVYHHLYTACVSIGRPLQTDFWVAKESKESSFPLFILS